MRKLLLTAAVTVMLLSLTACSDGDKAPVIAVIDTGISSDIISKDNILPGKNYSGTSESTEDTVGHGTAVSAFIVGCRETETTGVCPGAKLVPLVYAVKDDNGELHMGDASVVARAIYDAVDEYRCDIILIPAGEKKDDEKLYEAVKYAADKGVLIISCAGNSEVTEAGELYYPGAYEEVLCVGSVDTDGKPASFSQRNECVDILADGCDLRLVTMKGTRIRGQGTSYSAAFAAGAAALMLEKEPGLRAPELRSALMDCTDETEFVPALNLERVETYQPEKSSAGMLVWIAVIGGICLAGMMVLIVVVKKHEKQDRSIGIS